MLTSAQMTAYKELEGNSDTPLVPPRKAQIPFDKVEALRAIEPGFGSGLVLLVGRELDPIDHIALIDCECGRDHIEYVMVREDGLNTPTYISGTFGEELDIPEDLQWFNAVPVEVEDWSVVPIDSDDLDSLSK